MRDEPAVRDVDDRDAWRNGSKGRFAPARESNGAGGNSGGDDDRGSGDDQPPAAQPGVAADTDPRRVQGCVLTENPRLELLQRPARLEPEFTT